MAFSRLSSFFIVQQEDFHCAAGAGIRMQMEWMNTDEQINTDNADRVQMDANADGRRQNGASCLLTAQHSAELTANSG